MESGSQNPLITPPQDPLITPLPQPRQPLPTPFPPYMPELPPQSRVSLVKSIWRMFILTNFGIGAYMSLTASLNSEPSAEKKEAPQPVKVEEPPPQPESPPPVDLESDYDYDLVHIRTHLLPSEPISTDQQKELFQWMLEEKRKIKPKTREEKKRNDQDKAILKQFLRSKSTPRI